MRRQQHAAHPHRRRRVERAVIGGDQVVDEGHHPGEPLELGPEVAADLALPLGEGRKRKLPAEAPQSLSSLASLKAIIVLHLAKGV